VRSAPLFGADAAVPRHEPLTVGTGRHQGKRHDDPTPLDEQLVIVECRQVLVCVPQLVGVTVTLERDAVPPAAGTVDPRE
jgi:hypothetical protein